jgi:hypothetical protein
MGALGWVYAYERGLVIGLIWAVSGAIVWDIIKSGSLIGVRQLRNWLSNISVGRLRDRISEMEKYRERIISLGSSDKALYLALLQSVVVILTMISLATIVFIVQVAVGFSAMHYSGFPFGPQGLFVAADVGVLVVAIGVGVSALIVGVLDTPERVSKKVSELDSEIAGLRSKLDARLRKGET